MIGASAMTVVTAPVLATAPDLTACITIANLVLVAIFGTVGGTLTYALLRVGSWRSFAIGGIAFAALAYLFTSGSDWTVSRMAILLLTGISGGAFGSLAHDELKD